jgi:hypothetical protein
MADCRAFCRTVGAQNLIGVSDPLLSVKKKSQLVSRKFPNTI